MTAHRTRSFRVALLLIVLGFIVYFFVLLLSRGWRDGPGAMKLWNEVRIKNTSVAVEQFHIAYNRWPTNLSELITNSMGVRFIDHELRDRWDREIRYSEPKMRTNGQVGSFGRDGRQGGSGLDEDFFVALGVSH
jgi:hypothetical protein